MAAYLFALCFCFNRSLRSIPEPGDVRLEDGDNDRVGRLEFYVQSQWATVCDNGFGHDEAEVICRQLGHSTDHATPVYDGPWSDGTGLIANITNCPASGNTVDDCNYDGDDSILSSSAGDSTKTTQCTHSEDVGVHCIEDSDPIPELRLVGGTSTYSGRVEINLFGSWGTICHNGHFWYDDAKVVCRHLGLPHTYARAVKNVFPGGSGSIIYSDLQCNGDEERIDFCQHIEYPVSGCSHSDDVGVLCSNHGLFLQDHLQTYDGENIAWKHNPSSILPIFRIQEGAVIKIVCPSIRAGGLNTLNDDHVDIEWHLGGKEISSDNHNGIALQEKVQMYQSNGLGFNGRKGKRLASMVYTARKEDNMKVLDCQAIDEDPYDSVTASSSFTRGMTLLVLPAPAPQHFRTTVLPDYIWIGGFVGEIHIPFPITITPGRWCSSSPRKSSDYMVVTST
ncbi:scavenger receptor cysteine-rich domain-containing group B protein-like [Amphiura filiformis]|uniref:scavenger receptor cysteine-rich domain-containing group B protein-like n=1 Tax=Amphiura filiformis TaxID=82378 RepID=UPI003B21E379